MSATEGAAACGGGCGSGPGGGEPRTNRTLEKIGCIVKFTPPVGVDDCRGVSHRRLPCYTIYYNRILVFYYFRVKYNSRAPHRWDAPHLSQVLYHTILSSMPTCVSGVRRAATRGRAEASLRQHPKNEPRSREQTAHRLHRQMGAGPAPGGCGSSPKP